MVIYIDIIILLNFAINTLLIWFTAYFRKEVVKWRRVVAGALFGSTYIAFFFFPTFSWMYLWYGKLLFSVLILLISFPYRRLSAFMQTICIFYFVAFVFGGGVFGLEYLLQAQNEIVKGIVISHNDGLGLGVGAGAKSTFLFLLFGFTVIYFLSRKSYGAIQEPRKIEAFLADVVVKIAGDSVICRGLVDTGNQLHEPITRIPVMVMEAKLLAHLLPEPILSLASVQADKLEALDNCMEWLQVEWQTKIRLIPFRSVSRGMDFMVAIRPDSVTIVQNGLREDCTRVLIGLNPIPLAADGKYQAIIHPALLIREEREMVNT